MIEISRKIFLFLAVILELWMVPLWLTYQSFGVIFGVHVAATFFFWVSFVMIDPLEARKDRCLAAYLYALVQVAFFPLFGLIFSIPSIFFVRTFKMCQKETGKSYSDAAEEEENGDTTSFTHDTLPEPQALLRDVSVESYVDIMQGTDPAMKTRVIAKLKKMPTLKNVRMLKAAAQDQHVEVRFCAAGALLYIESQINERIERELLSARVYGSALDYDRLSKEYWLYSTIELLDESFSRHYLERCLESCQKSLRLDQNQPGVTLRKFWCLHKLERYDDTQIEIENALIKWPGHENFIYFKNLSAYKKEVVKSRGMS